MMLTEKVYCLIRKEWVAALPEEKVRQKLIHQLIHELGFPVSCIAVEKELRQMPHLSLNPSSEIPNRRADIICFAKDIHRDHQLYPLLLIECKAIQLSSKVIRQVVGYNYFLKSYFIGIANQNMIKTGWFDPQKKDYTFVDYLPAYSELLQSIQNP